jgi:hypothetical protein
MNGASLANASTIGSIIPEHSRRAGNTEAHHRPPRMPMLLMAVAS